MKRIILTILIIAISLCKLMAQNDAMYIYRNDGVINAFLKYDVDSIKHSHLDMDSTFCKDFVVQEVWTVDSVYRIPLSVIDSVSFVTPPTVYKNDVEKIEDRLLPYIVGFDSLTLKLRADIPVSIIPKVGNKLVLLNGCDILPNGFSGIVSKIEYTSSEDFINVVCKQASIEDLFVSFCSVSTTYGDPTGNLKTRHVSNNGIQRSVYRPSDFTFKLGPFTKNCTNEISLGIASDGELALNGGTNSSVTIQPTFRIHTFLIVGEGHGTYFNCSITGNLEVTSNESVYGGINYSHDFRNTEYRYPIPQTANLVNFYIMPGLFFRANAVITASIKATRNYSFGMAFDYSSNNGSLTKPTLGGHLSSQSTEMDGCIDGSIAAGAFIETGFNLASRDIAKVCVRGEYGYQLSGNFVLRKADVEDAQKETKLYERLKGCSIEFGPFANASLQASVATVGIGKTWELSNTSVKRNIVPVFANTKFAYESFHSAKASTEMAGKCILPLTVGYKLYDGNNNEVADYETDYDGTEKKLTYTFIGLNRSNEYIVYPKVHLFGHDILANPKGELLVDLPELSEFKIIGSYFVENGFQKNGKKYNYMFKVSVTSTIKDLNDVADWGYAYLDMDGKINNISLKSFGMSYTDTRYSYFRSEASSKIIFYTYVRYIGSRTTSYSTAYEYDLEYAKMAICPDNNHPHTIDLGLPSGTKWACCNVGADNPEEYGGYYAWGETKEKEIYNRKTYIWYDSTIGYDIVSNYVYIGSDINHTSYDVAYTNLGNLWSMPTFEQCNELMKSCTLVWTQFNGAKGCLVTGLNGNKIFLPATGYRYDNDLTNEGTQGNYWSSTLVIDWGSTAYAIGLQNSNIDTLFIKKCDRAMGGSVRAVCLK